MVKKLVYGVGVNDAGYITETREKSDGVIVASWRCPIFSRWRDMIRRCYSEKELSRAPTYAGCAVVNDWLMFSNFKGWMDVQDWEGKALDKDILIEGNKVYGPDTCVFVSSKVNNFVLASDASRGGLPIGVSYDKAVGMYRAECGQVKLSRHETPEDAHAEWKAEKYRQALILADEQSDPRVAKALINRYKL